MESIGNSLTADELIEKIEANKHKADFSKAFDISIDLFKKAWWQGAVYMLIAYIVGGAVASIFLVPALLLTGLSQGSNFETLDVFMQIILITSLILAYAVFFGVLIAVTTGMFQTIKEAREGKPTSLHLEYLNPKHVLKSILLGVSVFGIMILSMLACYFPVIYVIVPIRYVFVVFAFNPHLSVGEIIKVSFKIGHKTWGTTFGTVLVLGLVAQLGILACLVGILFTAFLPFFGIYALYEQVIGFDNEGERKELEDYLR